MTTTVVEHAWSYSQLKNYETCAKRYLHYNVAKDVVEPESEQLRAGNTLHKNFEERVLRKTPLPLGYGMYEGFLAKLLSIPGTTYGEQKLAITRDMKPVTFFGKGVWFRTVIDFCKINGPLAVIIDYKDGKPKPDITQLQLMAAAIFIHDPNVQRIKTALAFVNHNHMEKAEFVREDQTEIWNEILPRVKAMQKARHDQEYPPRPSGLCKKYCAVMSCPFHGK